jgi:hypothetical protein
MIVDGELGEMLQEAGMFHFQPYFQKWKKAYKITILPVCMSPQ